MNTCENTRFSSLLLQKKGGAPTVMLVTDEYIGRVTSLIWL